MENLDIVYVVKAKEDNEELRYSLRSLENLPHRKVFIFGYIPKWIQNVEARPMIQHGLNKWEKTADSLWKVANEKDLSEDFILFNDDFFVMKPVKELPYYFDRTLEERVGDFTRKNMISSYTARLLDATAALKERGKPTRNYELHLPMIFNKEKYKKLWELYPRIGAKRSLYGNEYNVGGIQRPDCKVYQTYAFPNLGIDYLSTTDGSFRVGKVGQAIRKKFNQRSIYEQ